MSDMPVDPNYDEDGVPNVMIEDIHIAQVVHEANRALQLILNEKPSPHWEDEEMGMKMSAVDGVENVINGATPEENHQNWMNFRYKQGWRYGEVKDAEAMTHPCMVPYAALPFEQRLKDHLFSAIVHVLYKTRPENA